MKRNIVDYEKDYAMYCASKGTLFIRGNYEEDPDGHGYSDKGMCDLSGDIFEQYTRFVDGLNKFTDEEIMNNLPGIIRIMANAQQYETMFTCIGMAHVRDSNRRGVTPFDIKPGETYVSIN